MANEVTMEFVQGMPKAELHLHIEGSLEPELKLALAQKNHVDIGQSTIEEVRKSYQYDDLASFLAVYYPAMNVLQTEDDFYDLAMAYLKHVFIFQNLFQTFGIAYHRVFPRALTDAEHQPRHRI